MAIAISDSNQRSPKRCGDGRRGRTGGRISKNERRLVGRQLALRAPRLIGFVAGVAYQRSIRSDWSWRGGIVIVANRKSREEIKRKLRKLFKVWFFEIVQYGMSSWTILVLPGQLNHTFLTLSFFLNLNGQKAWKMRES